MDRIAQLVKKTREEHLPRNLRSRGQPLRDRDGKQVESVNHTLAIASLGGATMDNEWNYLQAKLMRALGGRLHRKPGPDMTQLDRARSGHFVRPRRCYHLSAGPEARR